MVAAAALGVAEESVVVGAVVVVPVSVAVVSQSGAKRTVKVRLGSFPGS